MIESIRNQQIKYIKKLKSNRKFRQDEGVFFIEGANWLREASDFPHLLKALFVTKSWQNQQGNKSLLEQIDAEKIIVTEPVMKMISDMTTPPGAAGLAQQPKIDLPPQLSFPLVLDNLSDPGNLGAIIRTAVATGVEAILLSPNCVDVFNPKVVRSCVGTLLKVPIRQMTWLEIAKSIATLPIYGLDAQAELIYTTINWQKPAGLMVGNESNGLSQEGRALLEKTISIPMMRGVESLNVSMAAGVVLFEALRQNNSGF